ncbi:MAG: 16S rRNA (guanine(966)-N(2))-methyltransferase RsmD [Bacteroidetes bacterium]|nr:16S rRNA (guanine(966)-N(2))-methyltransferase RsmD [Bacteroidota bacterium]MCL5026314.1 16S rRNA (guanine(966)-N(2))-methyltransferase RsmD [Chloroflexota bacterium]
MRVVAGEAKGRRLKAVPGEGTRPILDRVKVALFDTLGARLIDCRFLDLFAGTGGVGIEALSRGAAHATFVESNPRALRVLRENLEHTGLARRATVVPTDVFRFLNAPSAAGDGQYDVVFLAPPQYQGLAVKTMERLDRWPLLAEDALAVVQQDPKEPLPAGLANLALVDQRRYGNTILLYYERMWDE